MNARNCESSSTETEPIYRLSLYEACVYTNLDPYLLGILLDDFGLPRHHIPTDQLDGILRFLNANILGDPVIFRLWAESGFTAYNPADRAGRPAHGAHTLDSTPPAVAQIRSDS